MSDRHLSRECECADPMCPVHGMLACDERAVTTLYRIDMEDQTGTRMCGDCADDATKSGLFTEDEDL